MRVHRGIPVHGAILVRDGRPLRIYLRRLAPDLGHAERVESWSHRRRRYRGLKYSKGSRQARQRYSALQAVEPNCDRR